MGGRDVETRIEVHWGQGLKTGRTGSFLGTHEDRKPKRRRFNPKQVKRHALAVLPGSA